MAGGVGTKAHPNFKRQLPVTSRLRAKVWGVKAQSNAISGFREQCVIGSFNRSMNKRTAPPALATMWWAKARDAHSEDINSRITEGIGSMGMRSPSEGLGTGVIVSDLQFGPVISLRKGKESRRKVGQWSVRRGGGCGFGNRWWQTDWEDTGKSKSKDWWISVGGWRRQASGSGLRVRGALWKMGSMDTRDNRSTGAGVGTGMDISHL